ncbi:unnamed protein product [Paramecium pentaurelia]|uniref:Uncharacterized protein n=1 Tax=Paramecium pentaurelia TaxID=43138 RepID=A0A8S1UZJ1_9CILI|nr:unnamed protein product [Paramecium pentaurelia]
MFTLKLRLKQIVFQLRLSPINEIIIRKQILLYVLLYYIKKLKCMIRNSKLGDI